MSEGVGSHPSRGPHKGLAKDSMPSLEQFSVSDVYGRRGENLSRELLLTSNHINLKTRTEWPIVIPADDRVWDIGQYLRSGSSHYQGIELFDRDNPTIKALLNDLVHHRVDKGNVWFDMMTTNGDSNESRHNDFTCDGFCIETKHDGMFGGFRTGENKQGGEPTFNMCFEIRDTRNRCASGIYRDHDYFSFVLDNKYGEPLLVTYDKTSRLREFVSAWKRVKGTKEGGNDNSEMVLIWFPYYLNDILPNIED